MLKNLYNTIQGHTFKPIERPRFESFAKAIDLINIQKQDKVRIGEWPVHVSTAIDFCARQHRLVEQSDRTYTKRIGTANQLLWAQGKSMEKANVQALCDSIGKAYMYGRWVCKCERSVHYGFGNDPFKQKCPHCLTSVLHEYKEYVLMYDGLLTGSPDVLILNNDDELSVIEHKSIKSDDFKKLNMPEIKHKLQGYNYVKLLEANKHLFDDMGIKLNLKSFYVLYASKGYLFFGSPLKEFEVRLQDQPSNFLDSYSESITKLIELKTSEDLPIRELCDSPTCERAKNCPVMMECFSQ